MRFFVAILFFCTCTMQAQNRIEKQIDVTGIKAINISLTMTNKLTLTTTQGTEMELVTIAEGNYQNKVVMSINRTSKEEIKVSDALQPGFTLYDDKLSAHKVGAVNTKIAIPNNLRVTLEMPSGIMDITGTYKELFAKSDTADILINAFEGDAIMESKSGKILANVKESGIKTVTNSDRSAHIVTKTGKEIQMRTVLGSVIIVK